MTYRVGIPRALLYHQYHQLWHTFFNCLGAEVVFSQETNKSILNRGSALVADETCLPVKIFFGHAVQLAEEKVDFLFVPRMVSVERKAYICPKMMGIPDMLAAGRMSYPPLIKPTLNLVSSQRVDDFIFEAGSPFTASRSRIRKAWREALQAQQRFELEMVEQTRFFYRQKECLTILLLGHRYNIEDRFTNMNLVEKLKALDCQVLTSAQFPREYREESLKRLPKPMFWTYGKDLLGAAFCYSGIPGKKGVIFITSFGCGIDSFVGNMVVRHLNHRGIPHLNLTLDEHSGEAGVNTRVEAFIDMIRWRERNEDNLSTYGKHLDNHQRTFGISGSYSRCSSFFHEKDLKPGGSPCSGVRLPTPKNEPG